MRPKQHYNFLGCKAYIRMYKGKSGKIKITTVSLAHNHPTTEEIFNLQNPVLTDDERELGLTLNQANAKPSQIKRVYLSKETIDL